MNLPNVDMNLLDQPTFEKVQAKALDHPPRILLLYGSNRERSYSRLAVMEAGRISLIRSLKTVSTRCISE